MAKRRVGIILLLICFCLNLMLFPVRAASTEDAKEPIALDRTCTLSISYRCDGAACAGVSVELYRIADVSADFQYTLTEAFQNSRLTLNGVQTVGEWNVIRATLESYIQGNRIQEDAQGESDRTGNVRFDGLKPGLYLAIPEPVIEDDLTCIFDSALVALPGLGEDGLWQYRVEVTAKSEILPPVKPNETTEFRVLKLWKGDDHGTHRPRSIQVEIFRNGESYDTVILSEKNNWSYSWSAPADGAKWMVIERDIPEGYTVSVEKRGTTFVITNTLVEDDHPTPKPPTNPTEKPTPKPPAPDEPKTGDTPHILLYTVLMYASGILLVLLALTGKRKRA